MIRAAFACLLLAAAPVPALATVSTDMAPPVDRPPIPEPPPSAEPPYGDPLGQVWEEDEVSQWRGVWVRRGTSFVFDAYWTHPTGERVLAVLEVSGRGRDVTIMRHHPGDRWCRYDGRIADNWIDVAGEYRCSWGDDVMPWRARIVRMRDVTPAVLAP